MSSAASGPAKSASPKGRSPTLAPKPRVPSTRTCPKARGLASGREARLTLTQVGIRAVKKHASSTVPRRKPGSDAGRARPV